MAEPIAIAIDGPVAAGKTVVGQLVAQRLGFRFLDTGVMYRAVTWAAQEKGMDLGEERPLVEVARALEMKLVRADGGDRLLVDGRDITDRLRDPKVERGVSLVARIPGVRVALVEQQRSMADEGPIVMAGRDIGTVVLPQAVVKVFLTASVRVRARRRHDDQRRQGNPTDYGQVVNDLLRRDKIDSERIDSPLRPAEDALMIDTDDLTVEELARKILSYVEHI